MAEVLWYYSKNDQQLGPVSPAELKQLAANRGLSPEDLIWREGMEGWAPASRVKGLFPESREPAFAAAPVSNGPTETMPPTAVAAIVGAMDATPSPAPASGVSADVFSPPPEARAPIRPADSQPVSTATSQEPATGMDLVDLLWLAQVVLWAICIAIVFLGGLLFTRAFVNAENSMDEAAAATVFSTFFIGAYVVARAGERIAALLQNFFERRRK